MAGLYDKEAATYVNARPTYPSSWFSMLSALTPDHSLAWDVGTGSGQAAIGVAEHYKQVIATDISEEQIRHGVPHPNVRYLHTPSSLSDDELVAMIGGENSVDLITAATSVHWLDLPKFYSLATRLLKKPGGVIAVWTYLTVEVSPEFEETMKPIYDKIISFQDPIAHHAFNHYKTLPFPFENVGVGREGQPHELDLLQEMSFERFLGLLKSWSAIESAKQRGVDLLNESVVKEIEEAWGGRDLVRTVNFKTYMLAGKVKL